MKDEEKYSDFDIAFGKNTFTKDVIKRYNKDSIKQSIRNILKTEHYDRLYHPEIGSFIHNLIFSPLDQVSLNQLKDDIFNTLTEYEPRISLQLVEVTVMLSKKVKVTLQYEIIETSETDTYVYVVDRQFS